jgi:quinol monooxygenase YgiN
MIIRVFRAVIRPGLAAIFEARTRELTIATIRAHAGLVAFYPGRPIDESDRTFVMITVWESMASVEAFTGPDWRRMMIPVEEQPLLESCSVEHFEFFDDSAADPARRPPSAC